MTAVWRASLWMRVGGSVGLVFWSWQRGGLALLQLGLGIC